MESHQEVLVDQAIRHTLTRYDDRACLLRSTEDPRFHVVAESLAFAALLLARVAAGKARKTELGLARLLIDTLLPLQNTARRDSARGAFPMLYTRETRRPRIVDPDSREIIGSLLGLLVSDHAALLGEKRSARVREAVKLCILDGDQHRPESTSATMIAAWLELEFGDRWRGERLATDVALAPRSELSEARFGDPRAFARELWALSLWRRNSRLHDSVEGLLDSLVGEIVRFAHPNLPEIFGAVTVSGDSSRGNFPWLGAWLTWHALCGEPMLPKQLADPLHSCLYAFPALARLKLSAHAEAGPGVMDEDGFSHAVKRGVISGWRESDLHIEARSSGEPQRNRLPVVGARWRTPGGATALLRCRTARLQKAVCRKRFVHLEDPGSTIVSVHNLGPGETRMIDNGWWLSGLHFAMEGLQMVDAERSPEGLELHLRPTGSQPMLMFSPLG